MKKIPLTAITIRGFKSICELDNFSLNSGLNVLIGANGAGKSNFIEIFRLLREIMDQNLENYIAKNGGADGFLFGGPSVTKEIHLGFKFGLNGYKCLLSPTVNEKFVISDWKQYISGSYVIGSGSESKLQAIKDESSVFISNFWGIGYYIYQALSHWHVYHFHDTSSNAPMRRSEIVQDHEYLRSNAANIAPYLLHLKMENGQRYKEIVETVRLVAPFFDDFSLQPIQRGEKESVNLGWRQKGSDYPMQPYHLSDGTIRFICLATALLQPDPPSTMIFDEPELGLHPYAIALLAELMQSTAQKTQLIVSTQSPTLIDHFGPSDLIVVNRQNGASTFERLDEESLKSWLESYTLGELWQKNVIAGGPRVE